MLLNFLVIQLFWIFGFWDMAEGRGGEGGSGG